MICSSQTVRLVNHCFTIRTSRTSRGLVYTPMPSNNIQCTNCTTRKPMFHDPYESYESYGSWTCIYTLSLSNDMHFTNRTTRKPLFPDLYESYESNGSCLKEHAIIRVVSVRVYWTTLAQIQEVQKSYLAYFQINVHKKLSMYIA